MADPGSSALAILAAYLADKLTGGVVSDFGKKQFKKLFGIKDETKQLTNELRDSRDEFKAHNQYTNELISEIDRYQAEVTKLRVENNAFRKRLGEPIVPYPALRPLKPKKSK